MVNTSSHNKNNKRKLSVEEFLKMNEEATQTMPERVLVDMYDSIVANQFKTKPECKHQCKYRSGEDIRQNSGN